MSPDLKVPEIPEDLRQPYKNILGLIKEGITLPWFGNQKQKELIERIAALTQELEQAKQLLREDQYIAEANVDLHARLTAAEATIERLSQQLLDEGLIHVRERDKLRYLIDRLKQPISDEEWSVLVDVSTASRSDGCLWLTRDSIDDIIASRGANLTP
jgi:uncharacterized coiled-coil protein SlyX